MDTTFLRWLDRVRERCRVPFIITNDARPSLEIPTGGVSKSLHKRGRAVDIRTQGLGAVQKWRIAEAIIFLAHDAPGKVEWETVWSPTDKHWHLGVDDNAPHHEMIESDD